MAPPDAGLVCMLASMDAPERHRTIQLRPRRIAAIGLMSAAAGVLGAVLPAVAGPRGLAGAYVASASVLFVLGIGAIVIGVAAAVALLAKRSWAVAVMLSAALFLVGYLCGHFYSQGLGIWYPAR